MLSIRGPDGQEALLRTTDEHPFWAVDREDFLPAGQLQPGQQLLAPDGQLSTLAASEVEEHPEGVAVYNFEVDDAHTYFVLPGDLPTLHGLPVLVHNATGGECGGAGAKPPKLKGSHNPTVESAAARGRQKHREFAEQVKNKPGWHSETRIKDTNLRPDAIDPKGRPVELKPNTPSGRAAGARQIQKYKQATGTNGRVIYYDP